MNSNVNCNYKNCIFPMDADILPPSDDRIFKALLTHPEAKSVLIDVISTVIERKVIDVKVRNNELPIINIDEKAERFDINCVIDSGEQIDVEMHSTAINELGEGRDNFINKYLYYMTDLHSSQKSKGLKYSELVRTYQVTFCCHPVFKDQKNFVSRFAMRTHDGKRLSDQINMIIIELSKLNDILKKPVEKLTAFEKWSIFFKFAPDPVHRNLINDIITDKREISMAAALLQEISKDERERAILRSRRMAETDYISNMLTAESKGEQNAMLKIARNMLIKDYTVESINELTGLSIEQIKKLIPF